MSTLTGPSEQAVAAPDGLNGCGADTGERGRGLSYCPATLYLTQPRAQPTITNNPTINKQTQPRATHRSAVLCGSSASSSLIKQADSVLLLQCQQGNDRTKEKPDVIRDRTAADTYRGGE
jgi:hypothetical protein